MTSRYVWKSEVHEAMLDELLEGLEQSWMCNAVRSIQHTSILTRTPHNYLRELMFFKLIRNKINRQYIYITTLLFFNIVSLYFNTLFNWYINLTIDGTIYPSQHFPFGAAFVCQAGNFWTLLRIYIFSSNLTENTAFLYCKDRSVNTFRKLASYI